MSAPSPVVTPEGSSVPFSTRHEDVVLRRLSADRPDGFFVDVGARRPRLGNGLHGLHARGWTGIDIEPNPSCLALLREHRPRDRNLQLALAEAAGRDPAFFEASDTGLSTCNEAQAAACLARGHTLRRHDVRTSTLRDRDNPEAPGCRDVHFDNLNDFVAEAGLVVPGGAFLPPNVLGNLVQHEVLSLRQDALALTRSFSTASDTARSLDVERGSGEIHGQAPGVECASLQEAVGDLTRRADLRTRNTRLTGTAATAREMLGTAVSASTTASRHCPRACP